MISQSLLRKSVLFVSLTALVALVGLPAAHASNCTYIASQTNLSVADLVKAAQQSQVELCLDNTKYSVAGLQQFENAGGIVRISDRSAQYSVSDLEQIAQVRKNMQLDVNDTRLAAADLVQILRAGAKEMISEKDTTLSVSDLLLLAQNGKIFLQVNASRISQADLQKLAQAGVLGISPQPGQPQQPQQPQQPAPPGDPVPDGGDAV